MIQNFISIVKEHKDLLRPDVYERLLKEGADLPKDVQEDLIKHFRGTVETKVVVEEYDKDRMNVLNDALAEVEVAEREMEAEYRNAVKKIKEYSEKMDLKKADAELKKL